MVSLKRRRERVLALAAEYENVVVTDEKNLFYLTDFWGGGIGLVRPDGVVTLIVSQMEEDRAAESAREVEVLKAGSRKEMYSLAVKGLAVGNTLTDRYDPNLGKTTVDNAVFMEARREKDAEELERITDASQKIDKIYEMLETTIKVGKTEVQVAAEVMKLATLEGMSPLAAEGSLSPIIVAAGKASALPHAELTNRPIRDGDMVVADIFFRSAGYCSDCTRTYAVGRVSSERRAGYEAVLEAQLEGLDRAKLGTPASEVHEAVASTLRKRGLDRYFTHSTGHGVGIDIHESPSISGRSSEVLQNGDVLTIEPGIYVAGDYGVRIEDTVAIVGGASRVLFKYTKELLVLDER